ncbi:MAG TPA: iron-sulfur cluster assembly accessory protein [Anaerolineales bacterium]|nr:iron-sulfur cluster assembly accessory protein [Anaerolineales bacterium]
MITLSPMAGNYLGAILEQEKFPAGTGLRLGVTRDGCEGSGTEFRYTMSFEAKPSTPNDEVFKSGGINIYVDHENLRYLNGLQLDIRQHYLGEVQFVFSNPQARHSCGCGHTFSE